MSKPTTEVARLKEERDAARAEAEKWRDLYDDACAVLRSPDSTNDGGPSNLAYEIKIMRDNTSAAMAEAVAARAEAERLMEALGRIVAIQKCTLVWFVKHGVVFDKWPRQDADGEMTIEERWQGIAFSIYTDLCEASEIARREIDNAALEVNP